VATGTGDRYVAQDNLSREHIIQYYVSKPAWLKFQTKNLNT